MGTCANTSQKITNKEISIEDNQGQCRLGVRATFRQLSGKGTIVEELPQQQLTPCTKAPTVKNTSTKTINSRGGQKKVSFFNEDLEQLEQLENRENVLPKPVQPSKKMLQSQKKVTYKSIKSINSRAACQEEEPEARKFEQSMESEAKYPQKFQNIDPKHATFQSDGTKSNFGMLIWKDGSIYEGQYYGFISGKGRYQVTNGDYYDGQWKVNQFHGHGVKFDKQRDCKITGTWENGKINGIAKEEWGDGSIFEGMFINNVKCGHGRIDFPDGSYFQGNFEKDQINGIGRYHWAGSKTYEGQWLNNEMHGRGQLQLEDGSVYVGQFEKGKRHGQGQLRWPDGRKYIGGWQKGKQHGKGKIVTVQGEQKHHEWMEGKPCQNLEYL